MTGSASSPPLPAPCAGPGKAGAQKETGHTLAVVPGYLPTAPPARLSCLSYRFRPSAVARPHSFPGKPWELQLLDRLPPRRRCCAGLHRLEPRRFTHPVARQWRPEQFSLRLKSLTINLLLSQYFVEYRASNLMAPPPVPAPGLFSYSGRTDGGPSRKFPVVKPLEVSDHCGLLLLVLHKRGSPSMRL